MERHQDTLLIEVRGLYLDLMKRCLTNWIYSDLEKADPQERREGRVWPEYSHTMIGFKRLDNIEYCVADVLDNGIPGDLIETGVWRGGATIFMRAILKAYGVTDRNVWVADSFAGLPPANIDKYPKESTEPFHTYRALAVSLQAVKSNFERYGLLDDQVRFLKGWFRDTLPVAPIQRLAVVRLDGDLYESTMDALVHLYPKLSLGGYLIVDDYGCVPACRHAVEDYRAQHQITEEVHEVDWTCVYWKRTR
jgi:hypothetical protein